MAFAELNEQVLEEFEAASDGYRDFDLFSNASEDGPLTGFHIVTPGAADPAGTRLEYKREHQRAAKAMQIRRAILAGERPKKRVGKRGRPPTRWIEEAKKLGIDLNAPVAQGAGQ